MPTSVPTMPPTTDAAGQRHEYLEKALDEDAAVHAQNAADDDAGDEQIEKVASPW